jgi:hypothetical protein
MFAQLNSLFDLVNDFEIAVGVGVVWKELVPRSIIQTRTGISSPLLFDAAFVCISE